MCALRRRGHTIISSIHCNVGDAGIDVCGGREGGGGVGWGAVTFDITFGLNVKLALEQHKYFYKQIKDYMVRTFAILCTITGRLLILFNSNGKCVESFFHAL